MVRACVYIFAAIDLEALAELDRGLGDQLFQVRLAVHQGQLPIQRSRENRALFYKK
jgi:hypothetical protein